MRWGSRSRGLARRAVRRAATRRVTGRAESRPRGRCRCGRCVRPLTWGDAVVDAGVEHRAVQGTDQVGRSRRAQSGRRAWPERHDCHPRCHSRPQSLTVVGSAEADRLVVRARLGPPFCRIGAHGGAATQRCQVRAPPGPVDILADNREQPVEIRVSSAARALFSGCSSAVRYVRRRQGRGLRRPPAEPGTGDVRR